MILSCGLVREGLVFPVDIDIDDKKTVGHLKEIIAAKLSKRLKRNLIDVRLFLAKTAKEDETMGEDAKVRSDWLPDDETLDAVLQSRDVSSYMEMRSSWKLAKPSLFGPNMSLGEDVIHVLVVVPEPDPLIVEQPIMAHQNLERAAKRQKVEEAPDIWMAALQEERVDTLPLDREGLQAHLERKLLVKIPITPRLSQLVTLHDTARKCSDIISKLFEPCEAFSVETGSIVGAVVKPITSGSESATEDTYHHLWDSLIATVLRQVSSGNFRRNSNASTSIRLYRPDICFYCANQNVCVFRGEEKSSGEMEVPLKELYEKLIWRYDDAPYVFGYAAVGFQVCLVAIRKDSTTSRGAKAEVINHYDLSELKGRLSFLLALLNMLTLFRPVVELIQPFSTPDYGIIRRSNGVSICFAEDGGIKEYPSNMPSREIINNLKKLHAQMKEHSVPNVVTLVKANLKKRHVLLSPIGIAAPPSDVKQLVTALRDILTALVALHKLKLMHRDLRWENVLKYRQDHDQWFSD
ncbi:hypothetical protein PF010_g10794 [Phytophthora fragariae]|uniref:Crinkler effector protein N-terminal domain-containing protein n=2 Tax=Phytophthora fragariae TaxID=53985 RepID=A0A6G0L8Q3_9STRA|nr:hypothetical protein PF010_g10794 [Phytophthora fragariae]KAE9231086.1 hypothetical protein PF004_g10317 [Phytophthora fragariae]